MNRLFIIGCLLAAVTFFAGCSAAVPMDNVGTSITAHAAEPGQESALGNILSEFSTEFKDATKARAHNITMASDAIDQKTVQPGEVFSFNEAVGPTNKARGYMLGRIFVNGKDSKGYGGGVCQVSSTLFNAVQKAGLEVTERHEHSKPVGYVKKGQDATTSYGVRDFKFTNNMPFPVRINSVVTDNTVTVSLEAV